jgi:hypothetical protein
VFVWRCRLLWNSSNVKIRCHLKFTVDYLRPAKTDLCMPVCGYVTTLQFLTTMSYYLGCCFFYGSTAVEGLGLPTITRSPSHTPHSGGFRTIGRSVAGASSSTTQHPQSRHPCPRWDLNPQSQKASGHRHTSMIAGRLGLVVMYCMG